MAFQVKQDAHRICAGQAGDSHQWVLVVVIKPDTHDTISKYTLTHTMMRQPYICDHTDNPEKNHIAHSTTNINTFVLFIFYLVLEKQI